MMEAAQKKRICFKAKEFASDLYFKRVNEGIDSGKGKALSAMEVSRETTISDGVILRAEKQKTISITSFIRLCEWMEMPPARYFGTEDENSHA